MAYVRNDVNKDDLFVEVEGRKYLLKHEKKPLHDPNSVLLRN